MVVGVVCGFALIGLAVALAVGFTHGGSAHAASGAAAPSAASPPSAGPSLPARIAVPAVSAATLAHLPRATTMTTVQHAPVDLTTPSHGDVVRIVKSSPGFARPGADPVTVIPGKQLGNPTWLPVIGRQANWIRVRLPSRPNGATAWIPGEGLRTAQTRWAVRVALQKGTMTVTKAGRTVGSWPIGQGRPGTPTPVGRTFLLAGFVDPSQSFSPVIYATGAHSNTLDSFGGGPGTVAVHGWPTRSGRLGKVSHGCVRVPAAALKVFGELPSGTPIDIIR